MKICLFDPGIEDNNGSPSANLGDLIIQEAVEREISSIFGSSEIVRISTHTFPKQEHIDFARSCSVFLVGGTNLLESKMDIYKKWKVSIRQHLNLNKVILLGVGWRQYQEKPNLYTKFLLNIVLENKLLHSVRDSYTKAQLQSIGINNVLNTNCPTMWPLMNMSSEEIPVNKSENALVMLTDYSKQPEVDKKLLELVCSKYEKVFVWPQGRGDREYVIDLVAESQFPVIMLEHSFAAFKNFLKSEIQFDYIGTRLHGGIKCLLNKRRALVLEIDNRAKEIARDTNLPTSNRADLQKISHWIERPSTTKIHLNRDAIHCWRSQFSKLVSRVESKFLENSCCN